MAWFQMCIVNAWRMWQKITGLVTTQKDFMVQLMGQLAPESVRGRSPKKSQKEQTPKQHQPKQPKYEETAEGECEKREEKRHTTCHVCRLNKKRRGSKTTTQLYCITCEVSCHAKCWELHKMQ